MQLVALDFNPNRLAISIHRCKENQQMSPLVNYLHVYYELNMNVFHKMIEHAGSIFGGLYNTCWHSNGIRKFFP